MCECTHLILCQKNRAHAKVLQFFKILMPIRKINSLSKIEIDRTTPSQNSAEFRIYPTFIKDTLTPGENIFKVKINHNLPGMPVLIIEVEDVK